jgi:predicted acylesterase/phospholipase RssA
MSNSELTTSQAGRAFKEPHALVMKGGGIKGLAYAGALKELEKYYEFNWFVGTSAGAIAAVLLAAGYTTDELEEILSQTDFKKFFDARPHNLPTNLYFYHGLYPGDFLKHWVNELLFKKLAMKLRVEREVLLKDLPNRVTIYASRRDQDALEFDGEKPATRDTPAAHAVHCSMAIPYVFQPPQHHGGDVFDGGLQNNYPVDIFLRNNPNTKIVGLYLEPQKEVSTKRRTRPLSQIISILTEAADIRALNDHIKDTVIIDPRPIRTLQFGLHDLEKDFLLKAGRAAALKFLANQNLPNGPSHDIASAAVKEADKARTLVCDERAKRRSRRRVVAYSLVAVAIIATWAVWLRPRNNRQNNYADVNATSTPAVNASPENSPPGSLPSPANQLDLSPNEVVARHIERARSLYNDAEYPAALSECDKALRLDPDNREAFDLKNKIQKTINILNP